MRNDMFKIIVERPRWGAGHAASPKLKRMAHAGVHRIGLKRRASIGARYTKMHIEDFVLTRISLGRHGEWMFEGQVLGARTGRCFRRRELFVDPQDGILKDMAVLKEMLVSGPCQGKGDAR
ncbi:hypothetical protein [Altererythrobacter fulvus]|uniref:hypothetical protein n=1 Tax=Caenibius fulvus TaxID=2126012 RepID=UPI00301A3DED